MPTALPFGEWDEFYAKQKEKYPIRWFIFHTILVEISIILFRINRKIWEFKHKYIPKHQYHIIRTSLDPKQYHDPREQILYTSMDLVKRFIEITNETIEWESDPEHAHAKVELDKVYDWWVNKYPYRENELEPLPNIDYKKLFDRDLDKNDPEYVEWRRIADQHNETEERWVEEERQMLEIVVRFRDFLWYP